MFTSQNPNPNAGKTFVLFRPFVALWQWLFPPTVAHRDRQSQTSRIVAVVTILLVLGGIVTATVLNARTWYNVYQTWQSNRKIDQASEMEKQGRWLEAAYLANEAYGLDPDNPKVLRTLARYYTGTGQKEAFYLLDKLERMETPTDDDRLLRIKALANNSELKDAQTQIEAVLRNSPPTARMVEIVDQVMQERGRRQQLLEILRSYVALKPEDLSIKLKLGIREVELGAAADVAQGMIRLWELAETPENPGLEALKFLDQVTLESEAQERKLIALLEKHPLAGEEQRIAALRRLVTLEPARKTEIVEKAMQDRKDAKREDLVPMARWFTQIGEQERLLGYLKKEMVQDYAPLLGQYMNALTLTKRHDELEQLVEDDETLLTPSERAFYRAHLAFVTQKSREQINNLLVTALVEAQADARPQTFLMIAQWAELRGFGKVAEQAYRAASTNSASEQIQRMGFEGLLKLTYVNGNSQGFMDATRDTAKRWPNNQHFLERSLYASLLSGVEIERAIPVVQKLLDAKPDDGQRKLLMALALYRLVDPKGAAPYLKDLSKLGEISPGQGAVVCGILHRAGGEDAARAARVAQSIPADAAMLPEERKFLRLVRPDAAPSTAATGVQP